MKKKLKILLVIASILIVGGCHMKKEEVLSPGERAGQMEKEIQSQFETYMEEMYQTTDYEIVGIVYSDYDQDYDVMNAFSAELEGKFSIHRWVEDDSIRFEDTYQALLLRDEIENKAKEIASGCFNQSKIYVNTSEMWMEELGNPELTLDQAILNGESFGCNIWILIPPEVFESKEQFEEASILFAQGWENTGIRAFLSFYYLDENVFEQLTRDNCHDMLKGKNFKNHKRINVLCD